MPKVKRLPNAIFNKVTLDKNPTNFFIFGDNTVRKGYGGAAALRDHKQAYGFITKKFPNNDDTSFYKPTEYIPVFETELSQLEFFMKLNDVVKVDKVRKPASFFISKLGGGLANRYNIFEKVICPRIEKWAEGKENVILLW